MKQVEIGSLKFDQIFQIMRRKQVFDLWHFPGSKRAATGNICQCNQESMDLLITHV